MYRLIAFIMMIALGALSVIYLEGGALIAGIGLLVAASVCVVISQLDIVEKRNDEIWSERK